MVKMHPKLLSVLKNSSFFPFLKKCKYYLKQFYLYYRFIYFVKPRKDTWYFVLNWYATGDVYMLCSLIDSFKKEHSAEKITLLTWSQKHVEIISLFDVDVEVRLYNILFTDLDRFVRFRKGAIINLHHFFYMKSIRRLIGYEGVTLFDIFKLLLDIPLNSPHKAPAFAKTQDKIIFVEELFNSLNLTKGKTVILAPEATTIKEIEIDFWKELINRLRILNYDVALSAYKKIYLDSLPIPVINFSFKYGVAAIDYAGFFISMRSGFCDIISESISPKIILYPKMHWLGGDLINGATLKQLRPENNHVLFELEYSSGNSENIIDKIVKIMQNQEKNKKLPQVVQ